MAKLNSVTCLNRSGHKVSTNEIEGIIQKSVFTIDKKGARDIIGSTKKNHDN